ncbi:tRNA (adenine(58)-N(1))-methyltransferase catalytic subunit TRMT61A-like [Liolophura sinensis]|uniref:tRNA (adenine(58)-N(1))-methyltransferase catalytic subunit TRMT61A-like n=1 Tax=Liolophura sinensis TaxID=3198878 RepID=UPI0031591439
MSFWGHKKVIEVGDTVVLYFSTTSMLAMAVKRGEILQTRLGELPHSSLIGAQYGSKIECPKGFVHVLHATPELWAANLPHRYRVLGNPDISLISLQLDLKPGSVVVESGTAITILSRALIRTIQPDGHLHLFENDKEQAVKLQEEFKHHRVNGHVTVEQRDVSQQGFGLTDVADAVIIDVDQPWLVVGNSKQALKTQGGRFCSFSLSIEQTQKTCEALKQHGFYDIRTIECTEKSCEVKINHMSIPYLGFEHKTENPGKPLKREVKHEKDCPEEAKKVKIDGEYLLVAERDGSMATGKGDNSGAPESDIICETEGEQEVPADILGEECPEIVEEASNKKGKTREYYLDLIGVKEARTFSFQSESALTRRGHTGFLTFATLYPVDT